MMCGKKNICIRGSTRRPAVEEIYKEQNSYRVCARIRLIGSLARLKKFFGEFVLLLGIGNDDIHKPQAYQPAIVTAELPVRLVAVHSMKSRNYKQIPQLRQQPILKQATITVSLILFFPISTSFSYEYRTIITWLFMAGLSGAPIDIELTPMTQYVLYRSG
jgi:hypothetical protein